MSFSSYNALEVTVLLYIRVKWYYKVLITANNYLLKFIIEFYLFKGKNIRSNKYISLYIDNEVYFIYKCYNAYFSLKIEDRNNIIV